MVDEQKLAGANYIISFFNNIQLINHNFCYYNNILLELKEKYGDSNLSKVSEEERMLIMQTSQTLRYYAVNCYIQCKSIFESIKTKENPYTEEINKLTELINKVRNDYIIKVDMAENLIVFLNSMLVKEVVKNLLVTSQDIMNQIYTK